MRPDDCEHSWRDISLGGDALLSIAISGDILGADPVRLNMLLRFIANFDENKANADGVAR